MSSRRVNTKDPAGGGSSMLDQRLPGRLRGGATVLLGGGRASRVKAGTALGGLEVNVRAADLPEHHSSSRQNTNVGGGGGGGGHAAGHSSLSKQENTFKMSPDTEKKFMSHKVEKLLKDVLDAKLHNVKYDQDGCAGLAREVCCMIKDKTKEFEFSRYKLVTQVLLGQDTDQSVQVASRCLWNHETDDFAAATYRNSSLYAVAIVYGMYLD